MTKTKQTLLIIIIIIIKFITFATSLNDNQINETTLYQVINIITILDLMSLRHANIVHHMLANISKITRRLPSFIGKLIAKTNAEAVQGINI